MPLQHHRIEVRCFDIGCGDEDDLRHEGAARTLKTTSDGVPELFSAEDEPSKPEGVAGWLDGVPPTP